MAKEKIVESTTTVINNKKLNDVLDKIEKVFGKGSLMKMSDKPDFEYDVIPTGSFNLDLALGIGGYPRGRIIEIYGAESSGKSTLVLHAIANAQKKGLKAALVDSEFAFDPIYAESLGVDMENLYVSQPDNAEQGLEIINMLSDSGEFGIIACDSVAAMVPKSELEGEMGDSKMGIMARLMSQAFRKLTGTVSNNNVLLIMVNQTREKIGVMFGNPTTTTGGNALKFYASQRLEVSKAGQIKDGDEVVANKTRVKVVKNKTAPPFKVAEFEVIFGKGIDRLAEIIELAIEFKIINKAGSWFSYNENNGDVTKLGQGVDNLKITLQDNPELFEQVESRVLLNLNIEK